MEPKRIKLDTMYPVLSDELIQPTPLTEVYVDTIRDPKTISKTITSLNNCLALVEFAHLKRVSKREILLFPKTWCKKEEVEGFMMDKGFDVSLLEGRLRVAEVAEVPPKTKRQYNEVQAKWPCNFHPDKYLEKLVTSNLFSCEEMVEHEMYMKVAVDVANLAKQLNLSDKNQGVVVVDPKINSVVSIGYSLSQHNPIKHPVMLAIDNVAKTQNGGAWPPFPPPSTTPLNQSGIDPQFLVKLQELYPATSFGSQWFKSKDLDGPYLCTGYFVYSTHEPCIMCAMALVHSRVKRVFFGVKTQNGGLESLGKVHCVKDLNHHYEVFGGLCGEDVK